MKSNVLDESSDFSLPFGKLNFGSVQIASKDEVKKSNVWGDIEEETFIETGTFYGHGVMSAILKGCKDIHTVEINRDIWKGACNRILSLAIFNKDRGAGVPFEAYSDKHFFSISFNNTMRISLYHGSTVDKLPLMLTRVNQKSCFWLDAHYSGAVTNMDGILDETSENDIKVPILKELDIIRNHHIKNHTIMIDDYEQVCGSVPGGFEEIKENIKSINKQYKITKVKKEDQEDYIIIAKT